METRSIRPKRSVRHAQAVASLPKPTPSAKESVRKLRERRRQRLIVGGVVAVVLLAILVPAFGYWREVIRLGDHTLASVDGTNITGEDFARYLGARQGVLARQLSLLQVKVPATPVAAATPVASPAAAAPTAQPTPSADQVMLEQLQSEQASLSSTAMDDLEEAHLVLDEAPAKKITVSQAELDDALRWMMSAPTQAPSPGGGLAAAPATLPATGIVSLADAQQARTQIVGKGRFLSQQQFDELIVKPAVIKSKLIAQLAPSVPTSEEEVHARHILVQTEDEANAIEVELKGGADFAKLAKDKSSDPGSKDNGGDLGWFGKGQMVPEFEKAAFSLQPGQISPPVKTSYGYHIIQVLEKDPKHPISPARIEQLREQPYQDWLTKARSDPSKVPPVNPNQAMFTWIQNYVAQGN